MLVTPELDETEMFFSRDEIELILNLKINFSLKDSDYQLSGIEYCVDQKKFRMWVKEAK
ncbi:hypothetical protein [Paenibacillus sp. FSL W7-1287]